ncbi:CENP-Q a CENPA-CAD centromere complex subunit domain-containing protein [Rutstroemia sp. NJR-2017a BBW]|nr:CENP-Q a CENPA-CAD centromere complex subunit domain-containing protein [Rutstroemia sp. NJR-2017a BBW]
MSDAELDNEWQPTGRPQSTMARSFALALDEMFKLDNNLEDLDAVVSEKKREISSQTSELEQLEARIRATEEKLKAATTPGGSPPSKFATQAQQQPASTPNPTSPLEAKFGNGITSSSMRGGAETTEDKFTTRPQPIKQTSSSYSTTTALTSQMPGALPPTPGASEGEYEFVSGDCERTSADYVMIAKDGEGPLTGTE